MTQKLTKICLQIQISFNIAFSIECDPPPHTHTLVTPLVDNEMHILCLNIFSNGIYSPFFISSKKRDSILDKH